MERVLKIWILLFLLSLAACAPEKGEPGKAGAPGQVGPPGADGQPARVVKLCPGVTAYPGVFVEVALCINNSLFGVYSANGGFLTELPPGTYSSNAIGSACNLLVLPNCKVEVL